MPPGFEHAQHVLQRADRVLAVLEEVIGDHELLDPVGDPPEALAVVEDVRLDERLAGELRVVLAEL